MMVEPIAACPIWPVVRLAEKNWHVGGILFCLIMYLKEEF